ncbi:MAG: hypothetical protein AVO35_09555 [Candidatus Aegiribacteria sp. MLS_C]|nr:MAG: hypothetical protein AVO35_09555 [Candidatus Aegiribacteria sp. MLS_C]
MRLMALLATTTIAVILPAGCGDSATETAGTLPVVTGIRVDSLTSHGDTIAVTWDAVGTVQVEGYYLWSRISAGEPWSLQGTVEQNFAEHIADRTMYYTVSAFQGWDTSSMTGIPDNSRADAVAEKELPFDGNPVGFRVDVQNDSLVTGDPASPGFSQQFTVARDTGGEQLYIYPGSARPMTWPSGARTAISSMGGFVAPSPGDTALWQDSIPLGTTFFVALDDGHYCRLSSQSSSMETIRIDGQLQPMSGVRVFNQTW